ncbi:MAG: hypothetical protein HQK58_04730, partial [Deltaproteobacteria bacterium]|nr:hypothetical protein [Deltaproteobacteria bacterium]
MAEKLERFTGRPYWMITGACEPIGDIFTDRLYFETLRDRGEEVACEE